MFKKTIAASILIATVASSANAAHIVRDGKAVEVDACITYDNGQVGWLYDGEVSFGSSSNYTCYPIAPPSGQVGSAVKDKAVVAPKEVQKGAVQMKQ